MSAPAIGAIRWLNPFHSQAPIADFSELVLVDPIDQHGRLAGSHWTLQDAKFTEVFIRLADHVVIVPSRGQ